MVSGDGVGVIPSSSEHELSDKSLFIALGLQILLVDSPLAVILDFGFISSLVSLLLDE
jgi:hypothetical protein